MIKQPLFGQDSSPHKTSSFMGGLITVFIWLVLTLTGVFVKLPSPTPKYKEVQIVLDSTPVEEKTKTEESVAAMSAEEVAAVSEPVEVPEIPNPVETPVAQAKPTAPAKQAAPAPAKTQPAKPQPASSKTTDPSKKVNFDDYQYATDLSQGVDFNNVSNKKQSFDWSQFDEPSEPASQVSKQVTKVENSSSISGSAASTSSDKTQTQKSQSSRTTSTQQSASSATNSALSNIRNTTYSTSSGSNTKSITEAKTTKGEDGTLSMAMKDGSTRVLITPVPPVIELSEAAAAKIDTTKTVTIEFQVLPSGNVPRAQVQISPESLLPEDVRNEIYDQLSNWRFEASASAARASFEYTIEKR
ncbi:MAG: hypothetical protein K5907_00800 [Treponema sp.]|nr:hypothetical protein [Treponema sp.]